MEHTPTPVKKTDGLSLTGMILGISSVVLAMFLGFILGLLAIIFSSIGLKKKPKNGFAITGLITGIVGMLLSLVTLAFIIIVAYAGVSEQASDATIESNAQSISTLVESYNATNGTYPDFNEARELVEANLSDVVIGEQGTDDPEDLIYIPCYGDGGIIWYWSNAEGEFYELALGNTDTCEWNE